MTIDIMKQQPLLAEHHDIEANIMQTETTVTSAGSSQPAIPDGINIGWILKKDPRHYARTLDRYKSKWQDKDYLATVWKHQDIRTLVDRCPSEFATAADVQMWLQLLFDTRWTPPTPSLDDRDGETRRLTRACWNGRDIHLMNCLDFNSMISAAGRRRYRISDNSDALAMDADLAASIYRARNSEAYKKCLSVYGLDGVLRQSLKDMETSKPSDGAAIVGAGVIAILALFGLVSIFKLIFF